MKTLSNSHLHGEVVVKHAFPAEYESLQRVFASLNVADVLRPGDEFSENTRPKKPKRHSRPIGGQTRPALLPVDQIALNSKIKSNLDAQHWRTEPIASGEDLQVSQLPDLRGDFVRNRVFVEVEFGNVASMYRDFFKFQIASRSRSGEVAVLVMATKQLAKYFDTNVATYENAVRHLPYLAIGIQMPIWLVGIEPEDFSVVKRRYDEMYEVCRKNGITCHTFEACHASPLPEPALYDETMPPADS